MHDKNIKRYQRIGEIRDDSDFIRLRAELERGIVEEMRTGGYLPIHDMSSLWSTHRLDKKYSFILTMFAAFVGKKKALEYDFWEQGRLVKIK
jgi:hypothetical protein